MANRGRPKRVNPRDILDIRQIKAVELIVTRDINGLTYEQIAENVQFVKAYLHGVVLTSVIQRKT